VNFALLSNDRTADLVLTTGITRYQPLGNVNNTRTNTVAVNTITHAHIPVVGNFSLVQLKMSSRKSHVTIHTYGLYTHTHTRLYIYIYRKLIYLATHTSRGGIFPRLLSTATVCQNADVFLRTRQI
jgi:hypothetical protein